MKKLIWLIPLFLASCTYTITQVHTEGTASDVVDEAATPTANISPTVTIPTNLPQFCKLYIKELLMFDVVYIAITLAMICGFLAGIIWFSFKAMKQPVTQRLSGLKPRFTDWCAQSILFQQNAFKTKENLFPMQIGKSYKKTKEIALAKLAFCP